jgi:hypothetical protein
VHTSSGGGGGGAAAGAADGQPAAAPEPRLLRLRLRQDGLAQQYHQGDLNAACHAIAKKLSFSICERFQLAEHNSHTKPFYLTYVNAPVHFPVPL